MKKKNIKVVAIMLVVLTLPLFNGCGGKTENSGNSQANGSKSAVSTTSQTQMDISKIADKLKSDIKYDDELAEKTSDDLEVIYPDIKKDTVKSMKVYMSSSGGTAEEIACFEANDEAGAKSIEEGLNKRVETQKTSFKDYVPAELKRLEKALVIRKDNYIFLSVSNNPDKAKEIIG